MLCEFYPVPNWQMFKVNNTNNKLICMCSYLKLNTAWHHSGVLLVELDHSQHINIVFLLLTLNKHLSVGCERQVIIFWKSRTFWLLVLTLLPRWCKISSLYLVPVQNYWTWAKTAYQKNWFFWSSPYKIEVLITFDLIEMLDLPNFGHMNTSAYNLNHAINIFGDVIDRNYDVITFISKYRYLKRLG